MNKSLLNLNTFMLHRLAGKRKHKNLPPLPVTYFCRKQGNENCIKAIIFSRQRAKNDRFGTRLTNKRNQQK